MVFSRFDFPLEPPSSVKEWLSLGIGFSAVSFYLVYGTYAQQFCEVLTLVPAIFMTIRASNFLADDSIKKLVTWYWGAKVAFMLGSSIFGQLPGYYLIEAFCLCPLLMHLFTKIDAAEQQQQQKMEAISKERRSLQKTQRVSLESDKDTRDTTLSMADKYTTLIESARIFTDPPSILGTGVTLQQHYTRHAHIEDTLLESYKDETTSQLIADTSAPWGDSTLFERYNKKIHVIVVNQILNQSPVQITVNQYHPSPHALRVINELTIPIMFAMKVDRVESLDAIPSHGTIEAQHSEDIELYLPVAPCTCNISVDVVLLPANTPQPICFSKDVFFASTPIRFPITLHVL